MLYIMNFLDPYKLYMAFSGDILKPFSCSGTLHENHEIPEDKWSQFWLHPKKSYETSEGFRAPFL